MDFNICKVAELRYGGSETRITGGIMKKGISEVLLSVAGAALIAGCATTEPAATSSEGTPAASSATPQAQPRGTTAQTPRGAQQPARTQAGAGGIYGGSDPKNSVYYEFDGFDIKPEYRPMVEKHAIYLRDNPAGRITIQGNADERGSREYNVALGQKRAEAVMKMMTLYGARPGQIEAVSFGEEKPRLTGHDEASWAENRRSDFSAR
jgi:peptidoglycan-associated lipoprotein